MTPQEHNKYVGIAHLIYAGLHVLIMLVSFVFMGFIFANIFGQARELGSPSPPALMGVIFVLVAVINILTTIPSVVAGFALLKRKSWAKIAGIVGGAVAAMSFPVGTAVAVYTFWFLFSEPGKLLYDKNAGTLPPPPLQEWQRPTLHQTTEREPEVPVSPPDWR
jgi:hypothetical protein